MTEFKYFIQYVTDKEGNPKDNYDGRFFIKFAKVGSGAILYNDDIKSGIMTSKVEDITLLDNGIRITTINSVYCLDLV